MVAQWEDLGKKHTPDVAIAKKTSIETAMGIIGKKCGVATEPKGKPTWMANSNETKITMPSSLLASMYPEDIDPTAPPADDYASYTPRIAGRAITFDGDRVALIHVSEQGYYMLPGGGVEHEAIRTGLQREIAEEMGYEVVIERGIGSITVYFDRWKQRQTDTCFIATKIGNTDQAALTDFEKQAGYKTVWARSLDEAIRLVQEASLTERDGKLVQARDLLFLQTLAREQHC